MKGMLKIFLGTLLLITSGYYMYIAKLLPAAITSSEVDLTGDEVSELFCAVPASGFRAWREGVVTTLSPVLQRNCTKVFAGDEEEIASIRDENRKWKNSLKDDQLLNQTANCTWVTEYFADNLYITKLERSFPIAYTFVVHNSPQQVLRLLKFLYRPMNTYCIHPDRKSSELFIGVFSNLAACLENVIIPSELVNVKWGLPSIMDAQMSCLTELVHFRSTQPEQKKWKYVINLCGKELPLMSTHTMVSYLTILNGSSTIRTGKVNLGSKQASIRLRGNKVPFDLPLYKSSTYMALSYEFAHHLLNNSTAVKLYEFFDKCQHPEEYYYATVYMIPGTPGGFNPSIPQDLRFEATYAIWLIRRGHKPCNGKNVHSICIVSAGDLKEVVEGGRRALFHNKYSMTLDHTIMDCMEERLVAENKREFEEDCIDEYNRESNGE